MAAGTLSPDGPYPENSFHGRVQDRLATFVALARDLTHPASPETAAAE